MPCLDENTLSSYLRRQLSEADRARVDEHLRGCEACTALIADLAEVFVSDAVGPKDAHLNGAELSAGKIVGRYVILRVLGAGGFGVVYAAYDPVLDRKIALKMVNSDRLALDESSRQRLIREAQAMAKLSHPHVTSVYDVAAFDDQILIAMEFIDGLNAKEWLLQQRPPWRQVLEVFLAAAKGLAAAHAAGLVHRDFKPANLLIGNDGRVSVTDFGLARNVERLSEVGDAATADSQPPSAGTTTLLDVALTDPAITAGTPAYMSPEQLRARSVGAASDQFSFGVSLYEALFGEHPFLDRQHPEKLSRSIIEGKRRPLPSNRLPAWLTDAVLRTLEPDPARRFASMEALIAALSPRHRSRRTQFLSVAAGLALLAAWANYANHRETIRVAQLCTGAPAKISEIWDTKAKARLRATFMATEQPFAEDSYRGVEESLNRYFTTWGDIFTDSCEATRKRGEQSEDAFGAQTFCLERCRIEARTVLDQLTADNKHAVGDALRTISSLTDLQECRQVEQLMSQQQPSPAIRARVEDARGRLAQVKALRNAGEHRQAGRISDEVAATARSLNFAPLLAESLLEKARGEVIAGTQESAEADLHEAVVEANRGRHDRVAAETWLDLMFLTGAVQHREVALAFRHAASAAIARLGHDEALEAKFSSTLGLILAFRGSYVEALAEQRHALELMDRSHGADAAAIGIQLHRVAELLQELGYAPEAQILAERSKEIVAKSYGASHPMMALPISLLAESARARGDYGDCLDLGQRAIAVRSGSSASVEHPTFLPKFILLAECLSGLGRYEEAQNQLARARRIIAKSLRPNDPWQGRLEMAEGRLLGAQGRSTAAMKTTRNAVTVLESALGANHPDTLLARESLGSAQQKLHHCAESLPQFQNVLMFREKTMGIESPLLSSTLRRIATCLQTKGQLGEAVTLLERAIALSAKGGTEELAESRLALAMILRGRDRLRAKEALRLAREHWANATPPRSERVAATQSAWTQLE